VPDLTALLAAETRIGDYIIHWGAVAAALTAIGVLALGLWRLARKAGDVLTDLAQEIRREIVEDVEAKIAPQLGRLIAEHQPNGGSSTYDAIVATRDRAEVTEQLLREHITASTLDRAQLNGRMGRVERKLDDLDQ